MDKINTRQVEGFEYNNWQSTTNTVSTYSAGWGGGGSVVNSIGFCVDGGGGAIQTGTKAALTIPYDATIMSYSIVSPLSGSIVFDIKRSVFSEYPSVTSIVGNQPPSLVMNFKNESSNLSSWSTIIASQDVLEFSVSSAVNVEFVSLVLKVLS